ncbi:putative nucleic acid-binding Zn-ribbon protein [Allocatelliglobosispora scoriae]|uniref:Putative nucleic acid-binding Zn-ribbon protein n=1 Tax=Allocatelliglobosispora scoriae TaxID=643052 RepID=A0A841BRR3_9ACTN|nr:C4-type zinc ribbon domain-containing protein [Allocatelliglobosispora scoriae]MBB5869889.1 putative nucleic acid-binding Zn-ribbon protein [Allocatelliglobosispora scoriae]
MKAEPEAQRRLLDLQALDTALAQLAHRRKNLPELAELAALAREISALSDERVRAQVDVDDLDRDITRIERDVDTVRMRLAKDQQRIDAGTGPARELTALQHEVVSLKRRQSDLEDSELELMEKREAAQATFEEITARRDATLAKREATELKRDQTLAEIAKEEEFKAAGRGPLAADLPADLVALYTRIRDSSGGIGAALLQGGRCGGCRLDVSGSEKARLRAAAPDEIVRCEECSRIMIRTSESGL